MERISNFTFEEWMKQLEDETRDLEREEKTKGLTFQYHLTDMFCF
jgi:hypothetical protein